jgi:DNA excision repair protein ERCC-2
MPAYCPTCKGIMRPQRGTLHCIRCEAQAKARTVVAGGRRITLAAGQQGLGSRASGSGIDPTLAPRPPSWRTSDASAGPHPQFGLFPYDTIRDGQKRFARDVGMAVQAGRHLVAHAPTGIGKTAASLAPALEHAIAADRVVLFLTSRQSQHRVAVETLRQIADRRGAKVSLVDLVAKRDMCLRPEASTLHPARFPDFCASETRSKSCQYLGEVDEATLRAVRQGVLHVDELMHVAKKASLCPHLVALAAAPSSRVIVADYNHLFSDLREQSLARLGLRLDRLVVIVDEAHNLPERIKQAHSHRVTPFLLDLVAAEARANKAATVERDLDALRGALARLAQSADEGGRTREAFGARQGDRPGEGRRAVLQEPELHAAFEAAASRGLLATRRTLPDMVADLRKLAAKARKDADAEVQADALAGALEDWGRFGTGALRYLEWDAGGGHTLHVRLLDPGLAARSVFQAVHSAILMSGTLRPPEMVRDLLGLDEARTAVRAYASPFPPENRLVVVAQGMSTRYAGRTEALWSRVAASVADVSKACRGNLAVFTPSYAILRDVQAALAGLEPGKELVVEDPSWGKAERDGVLDTLAGAKRRGGAILLGVLGGSFAEGVDFRDNLLSAVVVVGLPLAPPDLDVEATVDYLEKRFPGRGRAYGYTYPAMGRVLQAMGRAVRSETDRCAIVLLDERYLGPPYRALLPDEVPVVASPEPARAAAAFLQAHGL